MPWRHSIAVAGLLIVVAAVPRPLWAACPAVAGTGGVVSVESTNAPDPQPAKRIDVLRVGERLKVTLPDDSGKKFADIAACFDDTEVKPQVDNATPDSGVFWVIVPPVSNVTSGLVPFGDHSLYVGWSYVVKAANKPDDTQPPVGARSDFLLKPILTNVTIQAISEKNKSTAVLLNGDGFDKNNKSKFRIVLNDHPYDVCWPGVTGCTSTSAPKGDITGPHTIVLENVDLSEQAQPTFQVCFGDESNQLCSASFQDKSGAYNHAKVLAGSIGALVVISVSLVLLLVVGQRTLDLWGEKYVLSVLLLDKETDTYSLSKVQFYIWTAAAVFGYSYLTLSRFLVQHWYELPAVPQGLPGIVGIAAGTAVGAQVVTQANGPKGAGKLRPSLADLVTTGDVVAAERVQYLVWTIIGAVGFFLAVAYLDPRTLTVLPDVPPSILAISGISAFGYLGGKLARSAGPVINEVIIGTGPDPDVVAPGDQGSAAAPAPTPAWLQRIQTASSAITDAKNRLKAVAPTDGVAAVLTPTSAAVAAASIALEQSAKLTPASTTANIADAKIAVDKQVTDSAKGADDAGKALAVMGPAKAAAADLASSTTIAKIAQDAAKAVQDLQAALLTAVPAPPSADSSTKFGLLELRGRMLSQDATFKISREADSRADDFQLAFDRLQPSPKDDQHVKKPRVLELDPDAGRDTTLAKRLLLVVKLDGDTSGFFAPSSTHTLTVTNPDSQKVVFKYNVPATQKPS